MNRNDEHAAALDAAPSEEHRELPPAALRALAEAEARRNNLKAEDAGTVAPRELGGRGGLDPARFGDWEIAGRAIDF